MIEPTDLYSESRSTEPTEDGDYLATITVRAKGFAGVRAYNEVRKRYVTRSGSPFGTLDEWTGCGDGWLKATYTYLIDGAEVALERQNDAWASQQTEMDERRGW